MFSCNNDDVDCSDIFIVAPAGFFEIVNSDGENLIGEDNVYQFENFRIYNDTAEPFLDFFPNDGIKPQVRFDLFFETSATYFLELNEMETDTLRFNFQIIERDCADGVNIINAFHNEQELEVTDDRYFKINK